MEDVLDIVDSGELDKDTVDDLTLEKEFSVKCELLEITELQKHCYINKMHGNKFLNLAVGLSDNSIQAYKVNNNGSLGKLCKLSGHGTKELTEIVWSPNDEHILYSCGLDGLVKMWDVRSHGSCALEYKDEEETVVRPFECMDASCNGRVLCAGSGLVEEDAYLVFWDQRMPKPLGGYWNSHTDDVTQVKFHKSKGGVIASGSMDGLINVFDITEQCEEDALTYSLNVENSIDKLCWVSEEEIASISQCSGLSVWSALSGDCHYKLDRDSVCEAIKRSKADDCYIVDIYRDVRNRAVLLAGSYHEDRACLRSVAMCGKLQPICNYTKNKQVVRCCWYNEQRDMLVTAGEGGHISLWRHTHV